MNEAKLVLAATSSNDTARSQWTTSPNGRSRVTPQNASESSFLGERSIPTKLASAIPPSYAEFTRQYFHKQQGTHGDYLIANTNRQAKTHNAKSLFINEKNLRSNEFALLMRNPELASKRGAWSLLLGNFVNTGEVRNEELIWLEHDESSLQDAVYEKLETAVLEYAHNNAIDENLASAKLDDLANLVIKKPNLRDALNKAGINILSPNQKFYILDKLMLHYLYGENGTTVLKPGADTTDFVKRVNLLKGFPVEVSEKIKPSSSSGTLSAGVDATVRRLEPESGSPVTSSLFCASRPSRTQEPLVLDYEELSREADQIVDKKITSLREYLVKQTQQGEVNPIERLVLRPFGFEDLSHQEFLTAQGAEDAHPEAARDKLMTDVEIHLVDDSGQALINLNHLAEAYIIDEKYFSGDKSKSKSQEIKDLMKDTALTLLGHKQS